MGTITYSVSLHIEHHNRLVRFMQANGIVNRSDLIQSAISMYLDKKDRENIDMIYKKISDKGKREMINELDRIKLKLERELYK